MYIILSKTEGLLIALKLICLKFNILVHKHIKVEIFHYLNLAQICFAKDQVEELKLCVTDMFVEHIIFGIFDRNIRQFMSNVCICILYRFVFCMTLR